MYFFRPHGFYTSETESVYVNGTAGIFFMTGYIFYGNFYLQIIKDVSSSTSHKKTLFLRLSGNLTVYELRPVFE